MYMGAFQGQVPARVRCWSGICWRHFIRRRLFAVGTFNRLRHQGTTVEHQHKLISTGMVLVLPDLLDWGFGELEPKQTVFEATFLLELDIPLLVKSYGYSSDVDI